MSISTKELYQLFWKPDGAFGGAQKSPEDEKTIQIVLNWSSSRRPLIETAVEYATFRARTLKRKGFSPSNLGELEIFGHPQRSPKNFPEIITLTVPRQQSENEFVLPLFSLLGQTADHLRNWQAKNPNQGYQKEISRVADAYQALSEIALPTQRNALIVVSRDAHDASLFVVTSISLLQEY